MRRAEGRVRTVFDGIGSASTASPAITWTLDAAGETHQIMNYGAMQKLEPARARRLADNDLGDVLRRARSARMSSAIFWPPGRGERLAAEPFGQSQRVGEPISLDLRQLGAARRLDTDRRPWRVQCIGKALGWRGSAHPPPG